jgi:hypothetical protein
MNILEFLNEWGAELGVLGGSWGASRASTHDIRSIKDPKERAFMEKIGHWSGIFACAVLGLMLALGFFLQRPYRLLGFVPPVLYVAAQMMIVGPMCNRRRSRIRPEEVQSSKVDPLTPAESPAVPGTAIAARPVRTRARTIMYFVFWIIIGAVLFSSLAKTSAQQTVRITNTGSHPVDVRRLAQWTRRGEDVTLHQGATVFWKFSSGENVRIARSVQAAPAPGAASLGAPLQSRSQPWQSDLHQNADDSATIMLRQADRTAVVRVNDAGKIDFTFTDLWFQQTRVETQRPNKIY